MNRIQVSPIATELRINSGETYRKLASFAELKDGWAYGRGAQIDSQAIMDAGEMAAIADALSTETDAFPNEDGSVELALYKDDTSIYITILGIKTTIAVESAEGAIKEMTTNTEFGAFANFWKSIATCGLLGSRPQNNTSEGTIVSVDPHSQKLPPTTPHRSSNAHVSNSPNLPSANTLKNSTLKTLPGIQSYSPYSTTVNFRQVTF